MFTQLLQQGTKLGQVSYFLAFKSFIFFFASNDNYRIFQTIRRTLLPPKFGSRIGVRLIVRMQLTWLIGAGGGGGVGSQEAGTGSLLREACGGKSGVMLRALGWEEVVPGRCEPREAGAESPLQHTVVLGRRVQAVQARQEKKACGARMCHHHVTGVLPININIGIFHCRVTCKWGLAAVAKLQLPSCLNRLG